MAGTLVAGAPLLAGGPPGWVAYGLLAVATVGGAYLISENMSTADEEADRTLAPTTTDTACPTCPCERTVVISRTASPEAAQHIVDAQASGHPSVLTLDRAGATGRRAASLSGFPTRPGMDRDEYPPAVFLEGGAGASVRHITASDNRSAGAQMGSQLRGAREGCQITMTVGP